MDRDQAYLDSVLAAVDGIYDAAFEPNNWDAALAQIATLFEANAAALFATDLRAAELTEMVTMKGWDPAAVAAYREYFINRDIELAKVSSMPGGITYGGMLGSERRQLLKSEIHNDFWTKNDAERVLAAFVFHDDDRRVMLSMRRAEKIGAFNDTHAVVMKRLIPHVRRAFQIHRQFVTLRAEADAFAEPLDRLAIGIILCDQNGRIARANTAAEQMVAQNDGIYVFQHCLHVEGEAGIRLRDFIYQAANMLQPAHGLSSGGLLRAPRRSGKVEWQILVAPLPRRLARAAAAIVMINDTNNRNPIPATALRDLFGFTHREAELAARLAVGDDLTEAADRLTMAKNTARFHLRQLLEKTNTRRQSQLVGFLANSLARFVK